MVVNSERNKISVNFASPFADTWAVQIVQPPPECSSAATWQQETVSEVCG